MRKGIRIAIVGTSGCGKSTLARKLSTILSCDHIELDTFAWNPGWVKKYETTISWRQCRILLSAILYKKIDLCVGIPHPLEEKKNLSTSFLIWHLRFT